MPKRTNEFQRVIHSIHKQLEQDATVTESRILRDRVTNDEREVDVTIEIETPLYHCIIGVECRDRTRPADVEWVEQASAKHTNLTDKLVLVSRAGFTKTARRKAALLGIETLTLDEATDADWTQVVGKLAQVYIALPQAWPSQVEVIFTRAYPQPDMPHIDVSTCVYAQDGNLIGTLYEVGQRIVRVPEIGEHMLKTYDTPGDYTFGVSYKVPDGAFVLDDDTQHQIAALKYKMSVHIDERIPVSLLHRSFKDVHVAYGTFEKFGVEAILTVVEKPGQPLSADLILPPGTIKPS